MSTTTMDSNLKKRQQPQETNTFKGLKEIKTVKLKFNSHCIDNSVWSLMVQSSSSS